MPKFSALPPLQKRLTLILGLAFVCQLLPFVSRLPVLPLEMAWLMDLTTHWQLVWLTMGVVAAAILSVQRRSIVPWIPFVLGASLTWFATQPGTLRISQGPHETLTVVSANLHVKTFPNLVTLKCPICILVITKHNKISLVCFFDKENIFQMPI
jgi:hypothetical protein